MVVVVGDLDAVAVGGAHLQCVGGWVWVGGWEARGRRVRVKRAGIGGAGGGSSAGGQGHRPEQPLHRSLRQGRTWGGMQAALELLGLSLVHGEGVVYSVGSKFVP